MTFKSVDTVPSDLPMDGTPEDVAEAALYFAAFTSATGTVLTIDGGTSVGGP